MHKKSFIYLLSFCLIIFLAASLFFYVEKEKKLPSKVWVKFTMSLIKEKKPSPPEAARIYAYVTSIYYQTLKETKDTAQGSLNVSLFLKKTYPEFIPFIEKQFISLEGQKIEQSDISKKVLDSYFDRQNFDKAIATSPKRPKGDIYWQGETPLEPSAGSWSKWIVKEDLASQVSPPPKINSDEHKKALLLVKKSMNINNTQATAINFWGGAPGTESPSGIWLNRFYSLSRNENFSDFENAYIQMILAQSMADAFIECWKVKYTYWTARPSMDDDSIDLIWMANPNFPSYVSGHSVVSFTAAIVLSNFMPQIKNTLMADAEEAKNTRLWAGIHFPYDINEGEKLGRQIAGSILKEIPR